MALALAGAAGGVTTSREGEVPATEGRVLPVVLVSGGAAGGVMVGWDGVVSATEGTGPAAMARSGCPLVSLSASSSSCSMLEFASRPSGVDCSRV